MAFGGRDSIVWRAVVCYYGALSNFRAAGPQPLPALPNLGAYGRWAFAEFTEVYRIEADFKAKVESEFNKMIEMARRL